MLGKCFRVAAYLPIPMLLIHWQSVESEDKRDDWRNTMGPAESVSGHNQCEHKTQEIEMSQLRVPGHWPSSISAKSSKNIISGNGVFSSLPRL